MPRVALLHNIWSPYRVPLLQQLNLRLDGELTVVLGQWTHQKRRQWRVPEIPAELNVELLDTISLERPSRAYDWSRGVGSALFDISPDVIVTTGWDWNANWIAQSWGKRRSVPVIGWLEASERALRHRGLLRNVARRRYVNACDALVVPGIESKEYFERHTPHSIKATIVPNSVSPHFLGRDRVAFPTVPTMLYVGELAWHKGFDLVLDCAPDLARYGWKIVVAGTGPLEQRALDVSARLESFEYLQWVDAGNLADLMEKASVIAIPSRRDNWPLVAVEALSLGRPLILGPGVGSCGDLSRLVPDGVVPMTDTTPAALASAAEGLHSKGIMPDVGDLFSPRRAACLFASAILDVVE